MAQLRFDDSNISWRRFGDVEHLWLSVLDVDAKNKIVQVLFKFAAHQQIVLHRHKTTNKTFVIQGEHRLYHPDGKLKEIRPAGRYTVSPPSNDPHREGGGDQDVVVMFTIYGENDALYELLDDQMNIVASVSIDDFAKLLD
ncbi:cupin domain-containing protein [Methylocystis iwaonis]|uniref:cupin domain-containing protein n=1 Tax=Methylocystis iwaonis TaxID=2885079 RepID=UPI002E7AEA33|nr:regulator [Methylocystis iwaonis]